MTFILREPWYYYGQRDSLTPAIVCRSIYTLHLKEFRSVRLPASQALAPVVR